MGDVKLPRINEVTAYLQQFEPELLAEMEANNPQLRSSLDTGVLGGEAGALNDDELRAGLSAHAQVLETALTQAIARSHQAVERINNRLMRARRFRFLGEVLATVGASGVIGTALLDDRTATLVAGFLTLGSSLFALFANRVVLGGDARENELVAATRKLTRASGSAELTQNLLEAMRSTRFDFKQMESLLKESNMLFAEMNDALSTSDL